MLEQLHEQRIHVQAVLEDETVTKSTARKALSMRASQWELIQQLQTAGKGNYDHVWGNARRALIYLPHYPQSGEWGAES